MNVQDLTGKVSQADISTIEGTSTPLDVKVIFTSADSKPGLEMQVHDMVTSANTLAIGVDPEHHYSFTHFGTGTGIRHADYYAIEHAGNGEFHAGHWGAGVRAIVNAASAASAQTQRSEVVIQEPVTVVEHHAAVWPYLLGFGLLAAACLLAWRWMRRRSISIENAAQEARDEAQEMRKRNIEEQGWHDKFAVKVGQPAPPAATVEVGSSQPTAQLRAIPPSYSAAEVDQRMAQELRGPRYAVPQPQYLQSAPVIIAAQPTMYGGNDGFLTGMLVGEALERPQREVVREVVREPVYERESRQESSGWGGSSSDSGGGGSSWDSGGSSDSGGGGGFDSGGSDGGGGGGDF